MIVRYTLHLQHLARRARAIVYVDSGVWIHHQGFVRMDFLGMGRLRNNQRKDKHGQANRSLQDAPQTRRAGFDRQSPHGSVALSSAEKMCDRRFPPRFTVNYISHRNEITRIHFLELPNHINVLGRRIQDKTSLLVNQQSRGTKPFESLCRFRVTGVNPGRDLTQAPAPFRAGPNQKQGFNLWHGSDVSYDELPNFIGNVGFWHAVRRGRGGFPEAR